MKHLGWLILGGARWRVDAASYGSMSRLGAE
jgi:hypothetical protein